MPYQFDDEDFYSVNYDDPEKKKKLFDPLSSYESRLIGSRSKLKRTDSGIVGFERSEDNSTYQPLPPQQNISKAESETYPIVEQSQFKGDYAWWRNEDGYKEWLRSQKMDPDKLSDFNGNKLFVEYIKWKAENPEGFAKLSGDIAKGLGGVIQSVSETVASVPGLEKVIKPVGSVMQFIGNLLDLPRNILAGAYTALSSGHADETFENMWDAFKFSISATGGKENEDGKYFSWMDGELRNLVDKAREGMSDKEYQQYIDSDSFRQTKRLWQTGGLLLDMVLDPA